MYLRVLFSVALVFNVVPGCVSLRIAEAYSTLTPASFLCSSFSWQKHGPPDPEFRWHEKERLAALRAIKTLKERDCLYGFEVNLRVEGRVVGGLTDIHRRFFKITIILDTYCAAVRFN